MFYWELKASKCLFDVFCYHFLNDITCFTQSINLMCLKTLGQNNMSFQSLERSKKTWKGGLFTDFQWKSFRWLERCRSDLTESLQMLEISSFQLNCFKKNIFLDLSNVQKDHLYDIILIRKVFFSVI